jgi:hypothetical protein
MSMRAQIGILRTQNSYMYLRILWMASMARRLLQHQSASGQGIPAAFEVEHFDREQCQRLRARMAAAEERVVLRSLI